MPRCAGWPPGFEWPTRAVHVCCRSCHACCACRHMAFLLHVIVHRLLLLLLLLDAGRMPTLAARGARCARRCARRWRRSTKRTRGEQLDRPQHTA